MALRAGYIAVVARGMSATEIQKLRELTGAGVMECKKALEEVKGDLEKAVKVINKRGLAKAEKRADRKTSAGCPGS